MGLNVQFFGISNKLILGVAENLKFNFKEIEHLFSVTYQKSWHEQLIRSRPMSNLKGCLTQSLEIHNPCDFRSQLEYSASGLHYEAGRLGLCA